MLSLTGSVSGDDQEETCVKHRVAVEVSFSICQWQESNQLYSQCPVGHSRDTISQFKLNLGQVDTPIEAHCSTGDPGLNNVDDRNILGVRSWWWETTSRSGWCCRLTVIRSDLVLISHCSVTLRRRGWTATASSPASTLPILPASHPDMRLAFFRRLMCFLPGRLTPNVGLAKRRKWRIRCWTA